MRAAEISERLAPRVVDVCTHLFPAGRRNGDEYEIGDVAGSAGRSLRVNLNGKAGVWSDFATGDKGDLLDLWAKARGLSVADAMREAAEWLGEPAHRKQEPQDGIPADAPSGHPKWKGKPSGRWCYTTPTGAPWLIVYRYDKTDSDKVYFSYDYAAGEWCKGAHKLPERRPLYRLHDFAQRPAGEIVLVEGEKSADALRRCGFLATTTLGGCGQIGKADFTPLAGWRVTIWRDADDAGQQYADTAAAMLRAVGAEPLMMPLPTDVPGGWDAADAVGDGWEAEEIRAQLDMAEPIEVEPADATADEPSAAFRIYTAREVIALPEVPFRVRGIGLPQRGLGLIPGPSGSGKGLVTEDLAVCTALGQPWRGEFAVEQCPVVIIVAEGWSGIAGRQRAVYAQHGIADDEDVPVYYVAASPSIDDADIASRLADQIAALNPCPRLALIDTYRATNSGDENDSTDTAKYLRGMSRLEQAIEGFVIATAHVPWTAERERGSTALRAAMDWVAMIQKEDDVVTMSCLKSKDGPEFKPLRWRIEPRADSATVVPIGDKEPERLTPRCWDDVPINCQRVLQTLSRDFGEDGATTGNLQKASRVPESSYFRTIKTLTGWGLTQKDKTRHRLTPAGRGLLP